MPFTRVCVDVDQHGHAVGWSYEHHTDAGPDCVHVGPMPGPFDTPEETFATALAAVLDRYGVAMRLFD